MEKNKIDKLYQDKLENFEPETPANVWPSVQESLVRSKRRKSAAFWQYSSIAAAILLAFTSGYFFNAYNSNEKIIPFQEEKEVDMHDKNQTTISSGEEEPVLNKSLNSNKVLSEKEKQTQRASTKENMVGNTVKPNYELSKPGPGVTSQGFKNADVKNVDKIEEDAGYTVAIYESVNETEDDLPTPELPSLKKNSQTGEKPEYYKLSLNPTFKDTITEEIQIESNIVNFNEENKKSNPHSFNIIALGGPAIGFRNVNYKVDNTYTESNVQNEKLQNTYSAGVKMAYNTSGPWDFQLGIFINKWEQNSYNIELERSDVTAINNTGSAKGFTSTNELEFASVNSGNINPASSESYHLIPDLNHQMSFIDLPLLLGYYIIDNKFQIKIQTGLNMRLLSSNSVKLIYPDGEKESLETENRNISVQLMAGPALSYRIKSRFKIHLEPSLLYGISPVENLPTLDTYHHQFVIFSGISYRL